MATAGRPAELARTRERLTRLCAAAGEARALRVAALAEIRRVVPADAHVWVLTDPETEVGADPLADVPCLPELPRLVRAKYLTAVNRWTALRRPPAATLLGSTGGDPSRSLVWRDVQSRHGVRDVASVVFRDGHGCWAFLDLWRCDAPFTAEEVAFLSAVAPGLTRALRRCAAATFAPSPHHPAAHGPAVPAHATQDPGTRSTEPAAAAPPVLLLSAELAVLGTTPHAARRLRELLPAPAGGSPVPAAAYNVAAQVLAREAGVDLHPPSARVHAGGGSWLTVAAGRLDGDDGRRIEVTLEPTTALDRTALFARAHELSARETELLGLVTRGLGTRELAAALVLSEHTVQDHLKSIFVNTGVHTRGTLVARTTGR